MVNFLLCPKLFLRWYFSEKLPFRIQTPIIYLSTHVQQSFERELVFVRCIPNHIACAVLLCFLLPFSNFCAVDCTFAANYVQSYFHKMSLVYYVTHYCCWDCYFVICSLTNLLLMASSWKSSTDCFRPVISRIFKPGLMSYISILTFPFAFADFLLWKCLTKDGKSFFSGDYSSADQVGL